MSNGERIDYNMFDFFVSKNNSVVKLGKVYGSLFMTR